MTEQINHLPTPWRIESAGVGFRRPHENHGDLAIVGSDDLCAGIVMGVFNGFSSQMAKTNAEFIIRACNNHNGLIKATEDYIDAVERRANYSAMIQATATAPQDEWLDQSELDKLVKTRRIQLRMAVQRAKGETA